MKKFARIIGTGSYLPSKVVTNFDLEKTLDTSDEWITARTGIKERRIVTDQNTCDLALEASLKALSMAELQPEDIDLIILSTTTPSLNRSIVGIFMTLKRCGTALLWSISILPTFTCSFISNAICSTIGACIRQGRHHSAQNLLIHSRTPSSSSSW